VGVSLDQLFVDVGAGVALVEFTTMNLRPEPSGASLSRTVCNLIRLEIRRRHARKPLALT